MLQINEVTKPLHLVFPWKIAMNQSLEDTILEGKKYKPNLLQQHLFHIFEIQVRSTLFYISVLMNIEV
jgi:hypothetical protein